MEIKEMLQVIRTEILKDFEGYLEQEEISLVSKDGEYYSTETIVKDYLDNYLED